MRSAGTGAGTTRERFVSTMHALASTFREAQHTVDRERQRVFDELDDIMKSVVSAASSDAPEPKATDLASAVKESEETIAAAVSQWREAIDRFELNAKFREDFDDSLLVLVYGLVKSGKSSLGNFVAHGRVDPESSVIESPHDDGRAPDYFVRTLADSVDPKGANEELKRRGKFVVDVEEATSAIQGFKLGGLTWVDSPGLGSVTERNGKLAERYTESADLVLVLMNISQPGRRPEFEAITDLLRRRKRVLVLLTRADEMDNDEVDGSIVRKRVMKPDKARREAEDWVKQGLDDISRNPGGDLLNHEVESVSVLYAEENPSEDGLVSSGLASLLERLMRIASEEGVNMKRSTPARNLCAFIDTILTEPAPDDEPGISVVGVQDQLHSLGKAVDKAIRRLEVRRQRAVEETRGEIVSAVESAVWKATGKESGNTLSPNELEALQSDCENRTRGIISRHLQEIALSTITDVQAAVTKSVKLDVPRDAFIFEEIRRTVRYKSGARNRALGAGLGALVGAGIGFLFGGPAGAGAGAAMGSAAGAVAGRMFASERAVNEVVGVDRGKAVERIAEILGQQACREIDECVDDLRQGCLNPIGRQANIVVKRLQQFEESLLGIRQSLENAA